MSVPYMVMDYWGFSMSSSSSSITKPALPGAFTPFFTMVTGTTFYSFGKLIAVWRKLRFIESRQLLFIGFNFRHNL